MFLWCIDNFEIYIKKKNYSNKLQETQIQHYLHCKKRIATTGFIYMTYIVLSMLSFAPSRKKCVAVFKNCVSICVKYVVSILIK